ncbi:MAG: SpoIID/LytB domain-containing protein [Candidatus Planktophila sp.]
MSNNFIVALITSLVISAVPAQAVEVPASFSFTGSGYGHGVGMSQIGARSRALAGESASAILNYYFRDVIVAPFVDTHTIRVNIAHLVKSVSFTTHSPGATLEIYEGDLARFDQVAPIQTFASKKRAPFTLSGQSILLSGITRGKVLTLRWAGENAVVTMNHGTTATKYKYGFITIKVVKGALEVTNTLALRDEYLWGISEVSSSWPSAMLEAQAIASRSYALSKLSVIRSACDCQVYSHISDQNFVGYLKESEPRFGRLWKEAVSRTIIDTTTSLVVLSDGKPAQTYFFSSSGGATQSTLDAWGTATAYTQSVPDTASVDVTLNPRFATWKASISQDVIAKAFLLPNVASLEIVSRNEAGAVTFISATSSTGISKKIRGDTFRSRVKLFSPWFWLVGV